MYISKEATKSWVAFVYKGKKFLALEATAFGNQVTVIGEDFSNYGAYHNIDEFKKFYNRYGENSNLGGLT